MDCLGYTVTRHACVMNACGSKSIWTLNDCEGRLTPYSLLHRRTTAPTQCIPRPPPPSPKSPVCRAGHQYPCLGAECEAEDVIGVSGQAVLYPLLHQIPHTVRGGEQVLM